MEDMVEKQSIPWERRKELGFFRALWETIEQILFKPNVFFSNLNTQGSHLDPLLFYFIISSTLGVISFTFNIITKKSYDLASNFLGLFLLFILIVLALYVVSLIWHLFVLLFKGKGGLSGTFNVLAYNSAATLFNIIPFIGILISLIWGITIGIIGFKRIHKLSTLRAACVYLSVYAMAFIFGILFYFYVPNFINSKLAENEKTALSTVKTIQAAIGSFAAANSGRYPQDEYDLKYSNPPYIPDTYNNKSIQGYDYSLELSSDGYKIIVAPSKCGITGKKVFVVEKGKDVVEENCNK